MPTQRERILTVLKGGKPDRLPWFPRLEMWYRAHQRSETLPEKYRGWDIRSIYRDQNLGYPGKWGIVWRSSVAGVDTITQQKGELTRLETITPVGSVYTVHRDSPELRAQGIHSLEVEHMIKGPEDYDVLEWLYEHTKVRTTYEEYRAFDRECGDDGIAMVNTPWSPPGYLFGHLIGWDQCYYHVYDYPQRIDRLLAVMTDQYQAIHKACAESPTLIISHGAHFHSTMTPPPVFKEYFLPYLKEVGDYYHQHGKLMQFHGDADITGLEEYILEAGYDIAECLVTAPMVPPTLEHFREVWGNRIIIWGGIPSIMFSEPFTDEDFEVYMHGLLQAIAPGDAFILGIGDMLVPAAKWERFERVGEMIEAYGQYPIDPTRVPG